MSILMCPWQVQCRGLRGGSVTKGEAHNQTTSSVAQEWRYFTKFSEHGDEMDFLLLDKHYP